MRLHNGHGPVGWSCSAPPVEWRKEEEPREHREPLRIIEVEPLCIPVRRCTGARGAARAGAHRGARLPPLRFHEQVWAELATCSLARGVDVPLVPGPIVAWRAWALSGHEETLRLRPAAGYRPWPLDDRSRPAVSTGGSTEPQTSTAPAVSMPRASMSSCDELAVRPSSARSLCGERSLSTRGYRARFAYPVRLCLVCPICFGSWVLFRSLEPVVVAALRGGHHAAVRPPSQHSGRN